MTEDEIAIWKSGYFEHATVMRGDLERILESAINVRDELKLLVNEIKLMIDKECYESAQKLQPGLTREDYEAELEASCCAIKVRYYDANGNLKPRPPKLEIVD